MRLLEEREANVDIVKEKVDAIFECTKEKIEEQARYIHTLSEVNKVLVKKRSHANGECSPNTESNNQRNKSLEDGILKLHAENMQFLEERESYVERYVDNWESKMKELSRWAQKKIEEQARHVKTLSEFRSNTEKERIIQEREADVEIYVENLKEKVDAISEYTKEKIEEQGRHIQTLSELHRELVKKSCCVFVWPPCGNQEYTLMSAGLNDKRNEFFEDLITKFHSENMRLLEEREANAERYIQTLSEFSRILGKGE